MNIPITGTAGSIGSHTVDLLLQEGYEVRLLDSLTPPAHVGGRIYNLGNGDGYSVFQVIETVRQVTGHPTPAVPARRRGNPARFVASSQRIRNELGWEPLYPGLGLPRLRTAT